MYANDQTTTTTAAETTTSTTAAKSTPTNQPIHPALKSLWNIPHLLRFPDPLPPINEIRTLIQNRITQLANQRDALHPSSRHFAETQLNYDSDIAILENKLEELQKHFSQKSGAPDEVPLSLSAPKTSEPLTTTSEPQKVGPAVPSGPPSVPTTPENQSTSSVPATPDQPIPTQNIFPTEKTSQSNKPIPSQPDPECTPSAKQCTTGAKQSQPSANSDQPSAPEEPNSANSAAAPSPTAPSFSTSPSDNSDGDDDNDEEHDTQKFIASYFPQVSQSMEEVMLQSAGMQTPTQLMAEAALELKAHLKNKGRNRFDRLTPEQHAAIIKTLQNSSLDIVTRILALPPPHGMNFKISISGLRKFQKRYQEQQAQRYVEESAKAAADVLDKSEDADKAFQQTIERLLRIRALMIAGETDAPLETIDALLKSLTRLRKQALAERKQAHAENK